MMGASRITYKLKDVSLKGLLKDLIEDSTADSYEELWVNCFKFHTHP
jgi:hypothetical protein